MNRQNKNRLVEEYRESFGFPNAPTLRDAIDLTIYGGLVQGYAKAAIDLKTSVIRQSAVSPSSDEVATAMNFFAEAAIRSEVAYSATRPGVLKSPDFSGAIKQLNADVANGVIRLVPERFGMNSSEGENQVVFANSALNQIGQRVQLLLAGLNYATFTGKTMLTGAALLDPETPRDLSGWTEKQLQESMPHLVLSNLAIGQLISAFLRRANKDDNFSIVDTGSGTGTTLAGSILGIENAVNDGAEFSGLNMVGIEGGRNFFDELEAFSPTAQSRIPDGFISEVETDTYMFKGYKLRLGNLNLIYGDILDTLKKLDFREVTRNGVVIVTANYVWHRLPSFVKQAIIDEISSKAPDSIFLVADLVKNGSEVNRRYFNFRDNGLLNCGNIGLDEQFKSSGFKLFELNAETAPSSMDIQLAEQIGRGTTSDSIFYVAYKGPKAAELVEGF